MEKTIVFEVFQEDSNSENDEILEQMYAKVVSEPNEKCRCKEIIKCPECSQEILMIPSLPNG